MEEEDAEGNVTMTRRHRAREKTRTVKHRSRSRSHTVSEAELTQDEDESFAQQWSRVAESWWEMFEDHWRMLKGGSVAHVAFVTIIVLLVMLASALPRRDETAEVKVQRLSTEINRLTSKEFTADEARQVRSVLLFACKDLLLHRTKKPTVIVVAGSASGIDKFISTFEQIAKDQLRLQSSLLRTSSELTRREFETLVFGNLSASRATLLKDIDELRGTAPLVLHSVSDPDTSPFKNALIVVTIKLPPQVVSETCEERVNGHLLEKWRSAELTEDQVYPILSRITGLSVCLR
ncbi:hypothetical protein AAVH_04371 [Aphelenchoides avenae]|nr:hypothetical protein AAVH_04371 [Aphelenchus avenae]